MSVMAHNRVLTRDDLDALPDDGLRHELIDGAFVMTPAPGLAHQDFLAALYRTLYAATAETDLKVLLAPFDVILKANVFQPDIVVAPRGNFTTRELPTAPLLVVEVRSPATAWLDEGRKRRVYEEAGVAHYWLADPGAPSITVLNLVDGSYRQTAYAHGDKAVLLNQPFPVELVASQLAKG